MKRYWTLFGGIISLLLLCYGLSLWLGFDLGELWEQFSGLSPWYTASVGIFLLIADVFLPVPSMVVMLGIGSLFGAATGTVISLVGTVMASLFAFGIGRISRDSLERWVGPEEQSKADQMLKNWGVTALIMSRPMPLISETVALMAGASEMTWRRALFGSTVGSLPMCILYSVTGAGLGDFSDITLVFGAVILLAFVSWFVGRRLEERVNA